MTTIQNQTFDQERALYGVRDLLVRNCAFDGPADGESAFKECAGIQAEHSFFNLRYPFWHDHGLAIRNCELTDKCRAALWYSDHITMENTKLHGIKALRECSDAVLKNCDVISPEFGWNSRRVTMEDCTAVSEYFMMRGADLHATSPSRESTPSSTLRIRYLSAVSSTPRTLSGTRKTWWCAIVP